MITAFIIPTLLLKISDMVLCLLVLIDLWLYGHIICDILIGQWIVPLLMLIIKININFLCLVIRGISLILSVYVR